MPHSQCWRARWFSPPLRSISGAFIEQQEVVPKRFPVLSLAEFPILDEV